jgi:flagellar biosynthesis protein FlhG
MLTGHSRDQASLLRDMARDALRAVSADSSDRASRIIAVTSGKGGVGKTNMAANIAIALREHGKRVLVFDADLGLANIDVLIGMLPQYTIQHVLSGQKSFSEILVDGPRGIQIAPAASGVKELANLDQRQRDAVVRNINEYRDAVDYVIIDTAAGLSWNVLSFVLAAQEVVVVTTPDPTSITDAYAMIKVISREAAGRTVTLRLLVNRVKNRTEADEVVGKITGVAERFLQMRVESLGYVFDDPNVVRAVKQQRPFVTAFPYSPATNCVNFIAARLAGERAPDRGTGFGTFFSRLLSLMQRG